MPKSPQHMPQPGGNMQRLQLRQAVACPHCWHEYPPEKSLWVSSGTGALMGDPKLGSGAARRFPAQRFDVVGNGIDAVGRPCSELACPNCHLEVPRVFYEYKPYFVSIVGAPAAGKSFLLGAMSWTLRSTLPGRFATAFVDADPTLNMRLHEYERDLFQNPKRDVPVALAKTQVQGMDGLYDQVMFAAGQDAVSLPRPFVFRMEAAAGHPDASARASTARAVCMYDNAGESFLTGAESETSRATEHLRHSHATLFLYDPTQDIRFREACAGRSSDPQMKVRDQAFDQESAVQQYQILNTAAARMRKLRNMGSTDQNNGPLVVVVTKLDAWSALLPDAEKLLRLPLIQQVQQAAVGGNALHALRMPAVAQLSDATRRMLQKHADKVISAAEAYSTDVTYIPCSATGRNVQPLADVQQGAKVAFGIRPRDIKPFWCDIPFLVAMARNDLKLLPMIHDKGA